jgi:uncharacterized protein (TIGR02271 family)
LKSIIAEPVPSAATPSQARAHTREIVVPVVAEEIVTGTRTIERERVRVATHTEVRDVQVEAVRARDDVDVERVPIGREIDVAPEVRVEGDTTVIPIVEEVVVVEKRLVLREELRVTKRRVEETEQVRVRLRRERAEVSRTSPSGDVSHGDGTTKTRGG